MFITFEGIDGSGKTSRAKDTHAYLREQGYTKTLLTREPGGTEISDQIRAIVLDNMENTAMMPRAELLLFCASRAQLVGERIRPFLEDGGIVLCDRYADSTIAYQGYGHGLEVEPMRQIIEYATGGLVPDMTLYLDLDPEIGLERRRKGRLFSGEDWNRLDDKTLAFHRRVYNGYQKLMQIDPARWVRIEADQTPENVQAQINDIIMQRLKQEA